MNRRPSDEPVLSAPFSRAMRDPVTDAQLRRMWGAVRARRDARRAPIRSALAGAFAGAAVTATVLLAFQSFHRPGAARERPLAVAVSPLPLALSNGAPLLGADLSSSHVSFSDGSHVEIASDTRLEALVASATEVVLRLGSGRAVFDIVPGGPRRWTIEAGIASVEVVGTRFVVSRSPEMVRVDVERGAVLVRGMTVPDGIARLEAGKGIEVRAVASAPASSAAADIVKSHVKPLSGAPWRESAARGNYVEAYATLGSGGVERETTRAETVEDLLALADVARLSGHAAEAVEPLERIVREHASSRSAPLSAVTLGRIQLSLGRPVEAARALERALELRVPGGLEEDVYARLVEAYARAGSKDLAASTARSYHAKFPAGRRAAEVNRWAPK